MSRLAPLDQEFPIPKAGGQKKPASPDRHRVKDRKYLQALSELPCRVSWTVGTVEVHHLKGERYRMGRRAGDDKGVPLCAELHRLRTDCVENGEAAFWSRHGINPHDLAADLWALWGRDHGNFHMDSVNIMAQHKALAKTRLKFGIELND